MADQIPQGGLPGSNFPDRTNTGPPFGGQNPATPPATPSIPQPLQPGQLVRPPSPSTNIPNPLAPPGSPSPTPTPLAAPPRRPVQPKKPFSRRRLFSILLAALIIGGGIFVFTKRSQLNNFVNGADVSSRYNNIKLPLDALARAGFNALGGARNLSINGQLKVSDSIVLAPIVQPIAPITGQLYFDQSGSQLAYYNGSRFVSISDSNKSVVQSLGGVSGAITIGAGLNISGSTLSSTGVLSVSDASTTSKGVASFNSTNFSVTNGAVNTIQDINTAASPTFSQLTLTNGLIASKITPSATLTVGGNLNLTSGNQFQINGVQISSANLSDGANLAKLNGFNVFKNATNSVTSFQIQNASGNTTVFNADATNGRIGVGNAAPAFPLDVTGDINTSTGLRIGGTTVCTSSGCTAASGSGNFIQNSTTVQTNANFAIQSAAASNIGGLIRGASSQTADLLDLQNSSGTNLFSVSSAGAAKVAAALTVSAGGAAITGNSTINGSLTGLTGLAVSSGTVSLPNNSIADAALSTNVAFLNGTQTFTGVNTFKNSSNSVTSFQIQNAAASTTVLNADTTNGRIGIGNAAPAFPLDVTGDINTSGVYRIGGTTICTSSGCTAASGSSNFIQNGTTVQTNANFAIQSAAAANIGGLIRGAASQTADLFDLQTSTPATVLSVNASGSILQKTVTNSTTALQVQNASGTNALSVDTTNLRVMVGSSTAPDTTFMVAGNGTGFARIGTPDGCNANYTAISLSGPMSGCGNYNFLSSPTDQVLYINRPTGNSIIFRENNVTQFTLLYGGAAQFQNTSNSTGALFVKNAAGTTTVLDADTTNGRVGINTATPAVTLEVNGPLRLSGTSTDSFITPNQGSSVPTKINIPTYDPGAFGQIISMGVPQSAQTTARVISLFDNRTVAHQPTLAVFSPSENDTIGFSWDGTNSPIVKTSQTSITLQANSVNALSALSSGRVAVNSTSASYTLDVNGDTNVASGSVYRIGGTTVCSGTTCTPASGSNNYIRNGTAIQTSANFAIQSAATTSVSAVIKGIASQTADAFDIQDSSGVVTFSASSAGTVTVAPDSNATNVFDVQNAAGSSIFDVDTTNGRIGVGSGNSTPSEVVDVVGNLKVKNATTPTKGLRLRTSGGSLDLEASGTNVVLSTWSGADFTGTQYSQITLNNDGTGMRFARGFTDAPATDSTTLIQLQNAAGTSTIFNLDSTNKRVGIMNTTPGFPLDVTGDINTTTTYKIGGTTVCSGTTCTPASGSTNYIQNGTAVQANANFAIQSAAAASVGAVIQGAAAQSADLLDIQNSAATNMLTVSSTGVVTFQNTTNNTNAFRVRAAANTTYFDVDTVNGRVGVGSGNFAPSEALDTVGNLKVKDAATPTKGQRLRTSGGALDFEGSGATLQFSTWSGADFTGTQYNQFALKNDGTAVAFNRSITVQSASTTTQVAIFKNAAGQTADLLQAQDSGGATMFKITGSGSVGLFPDVDSSTLFQVQNAAGTVSAFVVSTNNATAGANAANSTLTVAKDSGTSRSINAAGTINASGADYAEYFTQAVPGQMQPGQVVCLTPQRLAQACNTNSPGMIIGAVSAHPGYVGNDIFDQAHPNNTILVGLLGQIKVKVSAANGPIHAGDMLTISSQSGVATKAVSPGMAIGSALEDSPEGGAVDVYIHVGYYAPPMSEAVQPTYSQLGDATNGTVNFGSINVSGTTTLSKLVVTSDATINGQLEVSSLHVNQQLVVNGHIVSGGNSPIISASSCSATGSLEGTDTAGLVTIIVTKADCPAKLGRITFTAPFSATPKISLTPASTDAAGVQYYVDSSTTSPAGFDITIVGTPAPKTYKWYYHVIQ